MSSKPRLDNIRNRVVDFRQVPVSQLAANAKNWRRAPAAQRAALEGVLAEIGFAGAFLARETPEGLVLIDGHLRKEALPAETEVPVLIVDLSPREADMLLATLDPIGALAEADPQALASLLGTVEFEIGGRPGHAGLLGR